MVEAHITKTCFQMVLSPVRLLLMPMVAAERFVEERPPQRMLTPHLVSWRERWDV